MGGPAHLDVIRVVTGQGQLAHPRMPAWLLPLENNGGGDHYRLDLAAQGSPVVFCDSGQVEPFDERSASIAPGEIGSGRDDGFNGASRLVEAIGTNVGAARKQRVGRVRAAEKQRGIFMSIGTRSF